jgi:hypothetical protein
VILLARCGAAWRDRVCPTAVTFTGGASIHVVARLVTQEQRIRRPLATCDEDLDLRTGSAPPLEPAAAGAPHGPLVTFPRPPEEAAAATIRASGLLFTDERHCREARLGEARSAGRHRERRVDANSAPVDNGDDAVVAVDADSITRGDLLGC